MSVILFKISIIATGPIATTRHYPNSAVVTRSPMHFLNAVGSGCEYWRYFLTFTVTRKSLSFRLFGERAKEQKKKRRGTVLTSDATIRMEQRFLTGQCPVIQSDRPEFFHRRRWSWRRTRRDLRRFGRGCWAPEERSAEPTDPGPALIQLTQLKTRKKNTGSPQF